MISCVGVMLLVVGLIYSGWWGWSLYQHVKKRLDSTEMAYLLTAATLYAAAVAWALQAQWI